MDVVLVKEAGYFSVEKILDGMGQKKYTTEFEGVSTRFGSSSNQLAMHLDGAADDTDAVAALAAIQLPVCTSSLLDITVDVGTLIVTDVTSITADSSDEKFAKVSVVVDDTTGDPEIYVFEKTTGAYGALPGGKTLAVDLKEYSVPAAGSALTEINDWIK